MVEIKCWVSWRGVEISSWITTVHCELPLPKDQSICDSTYAMVKWPPPCGPRSPVPRGPSKSDWKSYRFVFLVSRPVQLNKQPSTNPGKGLTIDPGVVIPPLKGIGANISLQTSRIVAKPVEGAGCRVRKSNWPQVHCHICEWTSLNATPTKSSCKVNSRVDTWVWRGKHEACMTWDEFPIATHAVLITVEDGGVLWSRYILRPFPVLRGISIVLRSSRTSYRLPPFIPTLSAKRIFIMPDIVSVPSQECTRVMDETSLVLVGSYEVIELSVCQLLPMADWNCPNS